MRKEKILALQGWRGVMMIMVFILHVCPKSIPILAGGNETISFFLILSGFCLSIGSKHYGISGIQIVQFLFDRLKKLWPLHFLVLLGWLAVTCMLPVIGGRYSGVASGLMKFAASVTLLQAFIPVDPWYYGLNGVAWYLSATAMFYTLFVPAYVMLCKAQSKTLKWVITGCVVFHACVAGVMQNSPMFSYWTYIFPPFRSLEFIIGICLGVLYSRHDNNHVFPQKQSTIIELLTILAFIFNRYMCEYSHIYQVPHNYRSVVGICIAMLIVAVFANGNGMFSKLLSSKVIVFLGNISFEVYLIHTLMLEMFYMINGRLKIEGYKVPFVAVTTLLAASCYHYRPWRILIHRASDIK